MTVVVDYYIIFVVVVGFSIVLLHHQQKTKEAKEAKEGFGMGPRGPQGLRGEVGARGQAGERGDRGLPGMKGDRGDKGAKGDLGLKGDKGERGEKGDKGEKGDRGERGEKGDRGGKGDRGLKGDRGTQGVAGARGIQGDPGTFGEKSCIFVGSNVEADWQCPDAYPVNAGASMGSDTSTLKCAGGVAKNATCNVAAGVGARAIPTLDEKGSIVAVKMAKTGTNYSVPPRVVVINGKGSGFSGESLISNGKVMGVNILNEGSGYDKNTRIEFVALDTGFGAKGMAFLSNSVITNIGVTSPGSGYKVPPTVWIMGGGGSGCRATAVIEDGRVVNINVLDGGSAYTYAPTVKIEAREAKFGCNYCHMCCKKQSSNGSPQKESLLEKRLNRQESLLQKLLNHTHDIPLPSFLKSSNSTTPIQQQQQPIQQQTKPATKTTTTTKQPTTTTKQPATKTTTTTKQPTTTTKQPTTTTKQPTQQYGNTLRNWAPDGQVKQSSTQYAATLAIDTNTEGTFSSTQLKARSYWQIDLPVAVELEQLMLHFNLLENKEMTVEISLENQNGARVGMEKTVVKFNRPKWDKIYHSELVVKTIRVTVVAPKVAKLALFDVKVLAKTAKDCKAYQQNYEQQREQNMNHIIDNKYDSLNASATTKSKRLYDTCVATRAPNSKLEAETIRENAAKFRKMMAGIAGTKKKKAEDAKKQLIVMSKQVLKDEELALDAQKLGVQPPPPMYAKEQIEALRKTANWTDTHVKKMPDEKAAKCMTLYNNYMLNKTRAQDLGEQSGEEPSLIPEARESGKMAEAYYAEYKATCGAY